MKKFYVVYKRIDDKGRPFKRCWFNSAPGSGYDTREEAILALNKLSYFNSELKYRLVEALEQVTTTVRKFQ